MLEVLTHIYVLTCPNRQAIDLKWRPDFATHSYAFDFMVVIVTGTLQHPLHQAFLSYEGMRRKVVCVGFELET